MGGVKICRMDAFAISYINSESTVLFFPENFAVFLTICMIERALHFSRLGSFLTIVHEYIVHIASIHLRVTHF